MKLVKLDSDLFCILETLNGTPVAGYGNRMQTVAYLIEKVEMPARELLAAFDSFETNGHNVADFGVNCTFIMSVSMDPMEFMPLRKTKGVA